MKFCDFYLGKKPVARKIKYCGTFGSKLLGLMFISSPGHGAFLPDVNEIHMAFVRFKLRIIWLDKNFKVIKQVIAVPWGPYYGETHDSKHVLELPIDNKVKIKIGDNLKIKIYDGKEAKK
jgi:uncharacterized membrane protein (UPF0127 family)